MREKVICKDCGCEFSPLTMWESKNQRHNLSKDCVTSLKNEVDILRKRNSELESKFSLKGVVMDKLIGGG